MRFSHFHKQFLISWLIIFAGVMIFCFTSPQYLLASDQDLSGSMLLIKTSDTTNTFVTISKEEIKKIVSNFIAQKIISQPETVTIKDIWVSNDVKLPSGTITYQCMLPDDSNSGRKVTIPVVFMVNGVYQKKIWAQAEIESLKTVVVTNRPLPRDHIITVDDIQLQKMEVRGLPAKIITRCEEVIGKKTKNALNANVVLIENCVELPPLVKCGDAVFIIAESGVLKISAMGEAREKGSQGQRIRVLNYDSKKEIYARVVNSKTVTVDF
jgi:flagellar basal body P-ring formation protein FlgA